MAVAEQGIIAHYGATHCEVDHTPRSTDKMSSAIHPSEPKIVTSLAAFSLTSAACRATRSLCGVFPNVVHISNEVKEHHDQHSD